MSDRTVTPVILTSFSYTGNLMTAASGGESFSLDYDLNGNMKNLPVNDVNALVYNWDNKLRSAQKGTVTMSLRYDPSGNRVRKQSNLSYVGTHKYIVDIVSDLPTVLLELNTTTGSVYRTYVYANSQIIARHVGTYANAKYFFLHDRLGSVRQMISQSGSTVASYTYSPFGETLQWDGILKNSNPFRFAGQYYDSEIGQYHLRARDYNPHIYRFASRDIVDGQFDNPLSLHKYLYCQNEPVNRMDLWGLIYEYGEYWNYDFDYEQTQQVINEALALVGTNFVLGPWQAFGAGGPYWHGMYDFKDTGNTFRINDLYIMQGSEFTNWLTGFTCFYHYGYPGEVGARGGGHAYAWGDFVLRNSNWPVDELSSRYFLGGGILMAQEARWQEGREVKLMKLMTTFNAKWDINAGGIDRLGNADFTSLDFDRELDLFLTFWNSGAP